MLAKSSDKAADRRWLLGVLAVAVLLSLLATRWTFDMWHWQNDEMLFRSTASWVVDNLPSSLWAMDEYTRGLQRLNAWLFAFCLELFGSPAGFKVARWVIVLAFASTVAPVWLLARSAGATRPWAAIAALAAVAIPWAVLTGTFLTEAFAYPLFGWACLAIWKTAVNPSPRADALALLAIGAATLARTGMVLLLVALAIVPVLQELRLAAGARELLQVPGRLVRRHRILVGAAALGLLVIVGAGSDSIRGAQYEGVSPRSGQLWNGSQYVLSSVAAGVAFVPVIVALGFALTQLVRPSGPRALALASLVIATFVTFTLASSAGYFEERYVFYWALPCAVALGVAASSRSASVPGLVIATALVLVSMGERLWRTEIYDIWGYLLWPAESFQARVVRLGIDERLPLSLSPAQASAVVIALATLAAVLIAAPLPRSLHGDATGRSRGRAFAGVAVGLGVLVVLTGAVQAGWAMEKWVGRGGGGRDLQSRTTIARALHGQEAGLWIQPAPTEATKLAWDELFYFTPSVTRSYAVGAQTAARFVWVPSSTMAVDRDTGRIVTPPVRRKGRLVEGPHPASLPDLMVAFSGQSTAALRGDVVARDADLGVEVVRVAKPASVRWIDGPATDGSVAPGRAETIRVFPPVAPGSCLRLELTGDDLHNVRFDAAGREAAVPRGGHAELLVPLRSSSATNVRVTLRSSARSSADNAVAGLALARGVVKCPPGAAPDGSARADDGAARGR